MLSIRDLISHTAKKGLFVLFRREEKERGREGKRKVSPDWPLDGLVRWHRLFRDDSLQGSHGRAFRALVARRIRTCRVSTCRHPSRSHPDDVRFPIRRHSSPCAYSFSRRRLTRGSLARWMELPPDTRASRIHRTRAASPSSTTNPRRNPWLRLQTTSTPVFSLRPVVHLEYIAATAMH